MNSRDRTRHHGTPALLTLAILFVGIGILFATPVTEKPVAEEGIVGEPIPGPAADPALDLAPAESRRAHPLGPEDLLEINVFEVPELNRTVRISETGTISLPLLGEMQVSGLTAMELEGRLRQELARKYVKNPQVSVFIREYGSKKVSVLGAVSKPGVYEMLGPRTLLQVLSEAGGLTDESGVALYVLRATGNGAPQRIEVSVRELMTSGDPASNVSIEPGDIISVPIDRELYIYVDGAVKTPGRIEQLASRPITLLQAIAKAGGMTDRANLKGVQILRQSGDGTQQIATINLKHVRKGKATDPILQDGDIIVVPETFF